MTLDVSFCSIRAAAALLAVSLFLPGCFSKPPEPIAPTWDVNLTAPIAARAYSLADLVEKDTTLLSITPGTGRLVFRTDAVLEPTPIGNILHLDPFETGADAHLGPVAILPVSSTLPVSIPGIGSGSPLPPLGGVTLPPIPVTFVGFELITLKTGTVVVGVRNNLPGPITLDGPVIIRDSLNAPILSLTFSPSTIPPGVTRTASADLADRSLTRRCSVTDVTISTPGGTSPVAGPEHLTVFVNVSDILVRRALLSVIPPQYIVDNETAALPLKDSTKVEDVGIAAGTLRVRLQNNIALGGRFLYRFDQLHRADGRRYVDSVQLPAWGSTERTIDLAGMHLRSSDGSLLQSLDITTSVNLFEGSGGRLIDVTEDDFIRVDVTTTQIDLDTVAGVVKPTTVAVDELVPMDWGDLPGRFTANLRLPSANLAFSPATSISFPVRLNLRIEARRPGGGVVTLPFPSTTWNPGSASLSFDPAAVGAFLSAIANDLPDSVRLVGTAVLNPAYDTTQRGRIGRRSGIGGRADLSIPLTLSIRDGIVSDTTVIGDTTGDGTADKWIGPETLRSINHARVTIEVENALPLEFSLKLGLLERSRRQLLDLPQAPFDSIRVGAAIVGSGDVVSPTRSVVTLELSGPDVRSFDPAQYVRYAISLLTAGSDVVTFRASDRLRIRMWSQFSYRVDP